MSTPMSTLSWPLSSRWTCRFPRLPLLQALETFEALGAAAPAAETPTAAEPTAIAPTTAKVVSCWRFFMIAPLSVEAAPPRTLWRSSISAAHGHHKNIEHRCHRTTGASRHNPREHWRTGNQMRRMRTSSWSGCLARLTPGIRPTSADARVGCRPRSAVRGRARGPRREAIARPSHGHDQRRLPGAVELLAQVPDVHVDDVAPGVEVVAEDLVGDPGARDHVSRMAHEELE